MKTILIPTDYNPDSLKCIPNLCRQFRKEEIDLVFIHMFKLSDSINELLMLSRRSREYEHISDAFYTNCNSMKAEHGNIRSIRTEFFYGSTMSMFSNFLEANNIDYILNPSDCSLSKLHPSSIDPTNLLTRCGLPLIGIKAGADEAIIVDMVHEMDHVMMQGV